MSKVKITAPGPTWMGTVIEIDGIKAQKVRSALLKMEVGDAVTLILEQYPFKVEFEGENVNVQRFVILDGKRYRCVEETP